MTPDPYQLARFFSNVTFGECWTWGGIMNSNGYGRFSFNNKLVLAHRFSHALFIGPIPERRNVCHSCDNRKCVNPAHLWLGTQSQNLRDAVRKGRMKRPDTTGARNGNTSLKDADVIAIKAGLSRGARQKELARSFGVDVSTISNIKLGKTWSHINA